MNLFDNILSTLKIKKNPQPQVTLAETVNRFHTVFSSYSTDIKKTDVYISGDYGKLKRWNEKWIKISEQKKVNVFMYTSYKAYQMGPGMYLKDKKESITVYLDCYLRFDEISGKDVAMDLYGQGYRKIFLATKNNFGCSWLGTTGMGWPYFCEGKEFCNWYYDYVYVEEENFWRSLWENEAKKNGVRLLVLTSTKDFQKHVDKISKTKTKIYLDCDLGKHEMRGDEFAEKLNIDGYQNLYIATNYMPEDFSHLPWLEHTEKGCPFSNVERFKNVAIDRTQT